MKSPHRHHRSREASLNVSSFKKGGKKKSEAFFFPVLLEVNIQSAIAQRITKTSIGKLGNALHEIK